MNSKLIQRVKNMGFPWETQDPFLFCVYHQDDYPEGNEHLGPAASLEGRSIGNDFRKKDGWRMYHGEKVPGFPEHPHRGFETVTFVLKGMVDHADSNGAAGRYGNRDVQWMTAGSGLQHAEMFPLLKQDEKNPLELFQIWLNLPAKNKMVEPHYKMLWSEELPQIRITDENKRAIKVDMVAGKIEGTTPPAPAPDSWAAEYENEVAIWHIEMDEHAAFEIPAAKSAVNRSLFYFEGETITIDNSEISSQKIIELNAAEKCIIKNNGCKSRFLFLQGKPINEPVIQYGPFVMNSKTEIQQAFADFQQTRFGGWPWPKPDMVHGKNKGRFAKFADGTEVVK